MNNKNKNLRDLLNADGYEENNEEHFAHHLSELSQPVLKRVRALKKLQLESLKIETEFYKKVYDLEKEFQPLFDEVNGKRRAIVIGEHEPTNDEADMPLLHGVTQETLEGFVVSFHFNNNPYFENSVLQKHYQLQIGLTDDDPFDYDGPTVVKSRGCEINWKAGKDVTQKVIKTKQKKGANTEEQDKIRDDFELGQILRDQVVTRAVLFFTGEITEEDDMDDYDDEEGEDDDGDENGINSDSDLSDGHEVISNKN